MSIFRRILKCGGGHTQAFGASRARTMVRASQDAGPRQRALQVRALAEEAPPRLRRPGHQRIIRPRGGLDLISPAPSAITWSHARRICRHPELFGMTTDAASRGTPQRNTMAVRHVADPTQMPLCCCATRIVDPSVGKARDAPLGAARTLPAPWGEVRDANYLSKTLAFWTSHARIGQCSVISVFNLLALLARLAEESIAPFAGVHSCISQGERVNLCKELSSRSASVFQPASTTRGPIAKGARPTSPRAQR